MSEQITRPYERLIHYTSYPTVSRENTGVSPSTPTQMEFARALVEELHAIGVTDAAVDENGYVYGSIAPNVPGWKGTTIALLAHMDVADASPCENAQPRVVKYEGRDLELGHGVTLHAGPELSRYIGKSLVVTDGSTLLGADDKAGIAEIMVMAETLLKDNSLPRGAIKICFTPDEEIGSGAELLDLARLGADGGYTLDGEAFGGVEYETFNAADVRIHFTGVSSHPGSAKGVMRSALLMATEFIAALPADQRPETTEGYEGYYFAEQLQGGVEQAELHCLIRDHDTEKFARRKAFLEQLTAEMNEKYGSGTTVLTIRDSYYNMRQKLLPEHQDLIDAAYAAVRAAGGEPFSAPVRGGTDGARLSYRGLPCPNLGTGCGNLHSRMEYACVEDMELGVKMLTQIAAYFSAARN